MGTFESKIRHYDYLDILYGSHFDFFIISSFKPYVVLSCSFVEDIGTIWILRFARIMHSFFSK